LAKEAVRQSIEAGIGQVRSCYERALEAWPTAAGLVEIAFVIASDGKVERAAIARNTTNVPALGCCIATAVQNFVFPEPDGGGIVVVAYPFVLESAGTPAL
jgi:hypothetical protein